MLLIDIILFGYIVNIFLFILFSIFMVVQMTAGILKDPKQMLEMKQLENNIQELKRLNMMAPFYEKYMDLIVFFLPYSSILKYYLMLNAIMKDGFDGYVENEIKRLRNILEERKNDKK